MKTASKPVPQASPNHSDQITLGPVSPSVTRTAAAPPKKKVVAAKVKAAGPAKTAKDESRPRRRTSPVISETKELVCRYCGSDDLAPSFMKRRDARCRACFKKRYGAVARGNKANR